MDSQFTSKSSLTRSKCVHLSFARAGWYIFCEKIFPIEAIVWSRAWILNPSSLCSMSLLDGLHRPKMNFSINIIQKLWYSSSSSLEFVSLCNMFTSNGGKGFQAFNIWCFQRTWMWKDLASSKLWWSKLAIVLSRSNDQKHEIACEHCIKWDLSTD
jgi:hypothetical protein